MKHLPPCRLCLLREADKKESHIISKLLNKTMLTQPGGKRKGFQVNYGRGDTELNSRPIQDTIKVDHILCTECEGELSKLETAFANKFYHPLKKAYPRPIPGMPPFLFADVPTGDIEIIKRLLYSIAWRANLVPYLYALPPLDVVKMELLRTRTIGATLSDPFTTTILYGFETPQEDNIELVEQNNNQIVMYLNDLLVKISFTKDISNTMAIDAIGSPSVARVIFMKDEDWYAFITKKMIDDFNWARGL